MRVLRTIAVAFSLYSRIPMPRFQWHDEDMTYSLSCFPCVGGVIGLIWWAVYTIGNKIGLPPSALCFLMTAIPLMVTGGFHVDGFMDVSDALSSFRTKEQKLAILKDPHIGAFAVIRLSLAGLIYMASLSVVLASEKAPCLIIVQAAGFVLARGLSGLAILIFRSAKNEGMLYDELSSAGKGRKGNLMMTGIWLAGACLLMIYAGYLTGLAVAGAAVAAFLWYRRKSYTEFGGITGDTAGWFVTVCEVAMTAVAAIAAIVLKMI